jgi:phosphoenolpyruvate synthase/pyruvate phosphate dikinase
MEEACSELVALERRTERTFGTGPVPLLVSVRSGAPVSMPGMMDTILNLGISRDAAVALAELTGAPAFVLDVTRRFQRCYWRACDEAVREQVDQTVPDEPWEGGPSSVRVGRRSDQPRTGAGRVPTRQWQGPPHPRCGMVSSEQGAHRRL